MNYQKIPIVLIIVALLASCDNRQDTSGSSRNNDSVRITTSNDQRPQSQTKKIVLSNGGQTPKWLEEVIMKYLTSTDNEIIKSMGADKERWIIDNVETTETGKYISINIGHEVTENDATEPRFVTDQWIGIDSATSTIYEYDIANDTVIIWHKK